MEFRSVSKESGKRRNFDALFHDSFPEFGKEDGSDAKQHSLEDTQLLAALRESLTLQRDDFDLQEHQDNMTYIPPIPPPPIDVSNHRGAKKFLAKMWNALHHLKETFTDPWKGTKFSSKGNLISSGWVDIDKFAAPSADADPTAFVAGTEQEEVFQFRR